MYEIFRLMILLLLFIRSYDNIDNMIKYLTLFLLLISIESATSQVLPSHSDLRILIVSDEVNPHNLADEDLTQPGDISAALLNTNVLNTSVVLEINTDNLEQATTELLRESTDSLFFDVFIYFAHRNPSNGNDAQTRQENFVTAVESYLNNGGGVISFHHGIYRGTGKQSIQNLLGSQATGAVPWDTVNGQDVIFVGGNHFIGNHNISYTDQIAYENPVHNIPASNYPAFNNTPDERYPQNEFIASVNDECDIKVLYESDYANNGNQHLLSYTKYCSNWQSQIFAYQPGEYQPNAFSGNNFQILLNAIYYLSEYRWDVIFKSGFD